VALVERLPVTSKALTAVSLGRTICDEVLLPKIILKGRMLPTVTGLTNTETAAEVLERKLAPPEYTTVKLSVPVVRELVTSIPTPDEFRVAVPSSVEPLMKLTVPVAGALLPFTVTVAFKVNPKPTVTVLS
jgi:hypothetical protein